MSLFLKKEVCCCNLFLHTYSLYDALSTFQEGNEKISAYFLFLFLSFAEPSPNVQNLCRSQLGKRLLLSGVAESHAFRLRTARDLLVTLYVGLRLRSRVSQGSSAEDNDCVFSFFFFLFTLMLYV